jgi:phosphopantetheinyl transferase (holo-ACP synthase)
MSHRNSDTATDSDSDIDTDTDTASISDHDSKERKTRKDFHRCNHCGEKTPYKYKRKKEEIVAGSWCSMECLFKAMKWEY